MPRVPPGGLSDTGCFIPCRERFQALLVAGLHGVSVGTTRDAYVHQCRVLLQGERSPPRVACLPFVGLGRNLIKLFSTANYWHSSPTYLIKLMKLNFAVFKLDFSIVNTKCNTWLIINRCCHVFTFSIVIVLDKCILFNYYARFK